MCRFGAFARDGGRGPVTACAFLARLPVSFGELALEVEANSEAGVGGALELAAGSTPSSLASLCCKFWICLTRSARSGSCGSGMRAGAVRASGRARKRAIQSVRRASVLDRVLQRTAQPVQRTHASSSPANPLPLSSTCSSSATTAHSTARAPEDRLARSRTRPACTMAPSLWRRPGTKTFQLVHRSQRDPLINDPSASDRVLKLVDRSQKVRRRSRKSGADPRSAG